MRILYYEINNKYLYANKKYYRHHSWHQPEISDQTGPQQLEFASDRIWKWDSETDEVVYIKNRETGIMTKVDRDEFLMVQLQSVEWRNETT